MVCAHGCLDRSKVGQQLIIQQKEPWQTFRGAARHVFGVASIQPDVYSSMKVTRSCLYLDVSV